MKTQIQQDHKQKMSRRDKTQNNIFRLFLFSLILVTLSTTANAICEFGQDTCNAGYVWRGAFPDDRVCVTGQMRDQAANDNAHAAERRDPSCATGNCPYGPNQCLPGFVWREAGRNDFVCVTGETHSLVAQDNAQAHARKDYHCSLNSQDPNTFKVLAYNIYMRPTTIAKNGQIERANLLPNKLEGYDAIIFSEAFDDEARAILLSGLRGKYPYISPILGTDGITTQDGGVIIVSKYPIDSPDQKLFGSVCDGPTPPIETDCNADKGVLYVKIHKNGRPYHLFGSHTQASYPSNPTVYSEIRKQQFRIIKEFIDLKGIPANEAVIIGGDLNVDKIKNEQEYRQMLDILNAEHPQQTGHKYSFDPASNDLALRGNSEYLDYILYSKSNLLPINSYNEVVILRSDTGWKEFFFEKLYYDLSDHYSVYGHFEFPCTISTSISNLEVDTDRMGKDYRSINLRCADPQICQLECEKDHTCKSFTFVKPGVQALHAICYLKNDIPEESINNCCTSGIVRNISISNPKHEKCINNCKIEKKNCDDSADKHANCGRLYNQCVQECNAIN